MCEFYLHKSKKCWLCEKDNKIVIAGFKTVLSASFRYEDKANPKSLH